MFADKISHAIEPCAVGASELLVNALLSEMHHLMRHYKDQSLKCLNVAGTDCYVVPISVIAVIEVAVAVGVVGDAKLQIVRRRKFPAPEGQRRPQHLICGLQCVGGQMQH